MKDGLEKEGVKLNTIKTGDYRNSQEKLWGLKSGDKDAYGKKGLYLRDSKEVTWMGTGE